MGCIGANAVASQAWQCNYNAIVTDGLVVENLNGRRQTTNEFHKFGPSVRQMRQSRQFPILFDHKILMVGSRRLLHRAKKFDGSVLAALGYAAGNSIPASTEANLSWPG